MAEQNVLGDVETEEVLQSVAEEYNKLKIDDTAVDEFLEEIHNDDLERKGDEKEDNLPTNNKTNNDVYDPNNNEFSRRCNEIINDEDRLNEIMNAIYFFNGLKGNNYLDDKTGGYGHLPVSLFPHIVSLNEWLELRKCSIIFHKYIDCMARDSEFLLSRMKCIAEADPNYTGKFYKIYEKKIKQKIFNKKWLFNSLRLDYMRNGNKNGIWSQIESQFNPGGACWASITNQLHKYLCDRYIMDRELKIYDIHNNAHNFDKDNLFLAPNTKMNKQLCYGLATAAKLIHPQNPITLIISDSAQQDCNWIAMKLWENHRIKSIFKTYAEVGNQGRIDENTKELIIDNEYVISFVYCRGGSKRKEWKDKDGMDWKGRELIEFCSAASDCTIEYSLINTKFMQTIYSQKDVLLKYLNEEEADSLYKHFVGNHNFDEAFTSKKEINKILNDVRDNYKNYVMKPSGDGGGHCIFGKDIVDLIDKLSDKNNKDNDIKLGGWILMEKIENVIYKCGHVRENKLEIVDSVQEIGIYSQYLCDAQTGKLVIINECIGDLIKTRKADANEAGISAGYGVIDSVILDATK